MGLGQGNGSLARVNGMIARLRKATTEWTVRFRQSYSESIREQPDEEASRAGGFGRSSHSRLGTITLYWLWQLWICVAGPKHSRHLPRGQDR
jgi:hypothetical protein